MSQHVEPSVAVIVPTYRRPVELEKCLLALEKQTYPPREILVVHRATGDPETAALATAWAQQRGPSSRRVVTVNAPGVLAAMEAGIQSTACDVVAVVDDDVQLRPDWLERCLQHYADPTVVGVGGRDVVHHACDTCCVPQSRVGRVHWYGRVIGNHHCGYGAPRHVDVLKGANMSMRQGYWILDHHLRGVGAQVYWEAQVCLRARRMRKTLVYDPSCLADHYPAPRFDDDQRSAPTRQAISDASHNEVYILMTYLRWWQRLAFVPYTFIVGHRDAWAFARWMVARVAGEQLTLSHHLLPSYRGKALGLLAWARAAREGKP